LRFIRLMEGELAVALKGQFRFNVRSQLSEGEKK
jgi:hypothetical protein